MINTGSGNSNGTCRCGEKKTQRQRIAGGNETEVKKNLNEKRDDVGELCKGSHKILTSFKLALQKYSKVNEYPWIAVFGDSNGENLGDCSSTLVKNPHHPDHSLG